MKHTILLLIIAVFTLVSCSKEDEQKDIDNRKTSAIIELEDKSGDPISNIVVYAYDEDTWKVIGDDPLFASFESASDDSGVATFANVESPVYFNELSNYTHTFRFSAHYSINGTNKVEVISITFNKGDHKTGKLILD